MTTDELWRRYAAIWSTAPEQRPAELDICLHEECHYCDPNGVVVGRNGLAAYMERFRQFMPGAHFEIASVAAHHGCSLSRWLLRGVDGSVVQTGRSFADCDDRGRLKHITGFFDDQSGADAS